MVSIFHITGGLGKHVLFSSIVNSFKKQYPDKKIIVSSVYSEIFERNPNVDESLNLNKNQYFYKNYIHNKEVEIFAHEPYKQSSHILKKNHLIDTWCDMINIPNLCKSSLHINFRETEIMSKTLSNHKTDKPFLVFQPFGGPKMAQQPYCWARDIHPELAQLIVNKLHNKYTILFICNKNHPQLNNCIRIDDDLSPNLLFSILKFSSKRILIDSCLQHAAHALNLPSMVIWNVTSPEQFGYDTHRNILPPNNELDYGNSFSYLFNYEISGNINECPYSNYKEMFDIDKIVNIIENEY